MHRRAAGVAVLSAACAVAVVGAPQAILASPAASAQVKVGAVTKVSHCGGQNAEVEQAVDPSRRDVYELWMGCAGIGFARSTDGGLHFDAPITLPGSSRQDWDPALAVAPDGTLYASFMTSHKQRTYPVVEASFDHGASFPQVSSLLPPYKQNWGDRDFIGVAPDGAVYVTWDYGPSNAAVTYICSPTGSCAFATGDLNVVIQKSTDGGRTWGPIIPVSPGFPASGGDSAPFVIEPDGRIDLEYQGYHITNDVTYTMKPAHTYFTSSHDGGAHWSALVQVGPDDLTMSKAEWWIDGAIGIDAAHNLYVTWDTQHNGWDVGWLAYSTDGGRTWSPLQRVTPDHDGATHIVEVAGGGAGVAYVGWLGDGSPREYAQYLRVFSIAHGWLTAPVRVSTQLGNRSIWPGDTFGISVLPAKDDPGDAADVVLSWGSALGTGSNPKSEIFAAIARATAG